RSVAPPDSATPGGGRPANLPVWRRSQSQMQEGETMSQKFERVFGSMEELLQHNTSAIKAGGRQFRPWRADGNGWVGRPFKDWADVCRTASEPWAEGLAKMQALVDELSTAAISPPADVRRRARWGEDGGDELDSDRLRSGQLDCWRQMH